jgi:hypothetical protein
MRNLILYVSTMETKKKQQTTLKRPYFRASGIFLHSDPGFFLYAPQETRSPRTSGRLEKCRRTVHPPTLPFYPETNLLYVLPWKQQKTTNHSVQQPYFRAIGFSFIRTTAFSCTRCAARDSPRLARHLKKGRRTRFLRRSTVYKTKKLLGNING